MGKVIKIRLKSFSDASGVLRMKDAVKSVVGVVARTTREAPLVRLDDIPLDRLVPRQPRRKPVFRCMAG